MSVVLVPGVDMESVASSALESRLVRVQENVFNIPSSDGITEGRKLYMVQFRLQAGNRCEAIESEHRLTATAYAASARTYMFATQFRPTNQRQECFLACIENTII